MMTRVRVPGSIWDAWGGPPFVPPFIFHSLFDRLRRSPFIRSRINNYNNIRILVFNCYHIYIYNIYICVFIYLFTYTQLLFILLLRRPRVGGEKRGDNRLGRETPFDLSSRLRLTRASISREGPTHESSIHQRTHPHSLALTRRRPTFLFSFPPSCPSCPSLPSLPPSLSALFLLFL
eukprot:GHVU01229335.1.p1 GENE.GHVU01229335.1~~GHVU01229335.1.p1  ORF type:complete len:177 (+),score=10.03 GHVU01229335.1:421-951(+)